MTEQALNLLAPPGTLPIGNGWRKVAGSLDIVFPFDGSVIGDGPLASIADADAALDAAEHALPEAAALTTAQRQSILFDLTERVRSESQRLEHLLVLETGKPLVDCRTEVSRTIVTLRATAEEVSRIHGETVPLDVQELGRGMIGYYTRKPAGIVIGIAGFNYPLLLATHKLAPAVAAGCPVIVKPAPHTPLATLELMALAREVLRDHGVSGALVQLVSGEAAVGERLVTDPRSQVVSFTGSAAIGHLIAKQAAPRKTLLELGSNTGFIIAQDADLEAAARTVAAGGFYANGQACIAVQRIVVERPVAAEFTRLLTEQVRGIVVGDPRDEHTRVAPVINAASGTRIRAAIEAAVTEGATLLVDGTANDSPALIGPTVVTNVPRDAELWAEEIFGPVVAITEVDSIAEAIEVVNDSRYGLQAAIFTSSLESAFTAIEHLEVGGVVVNEMPGFRSDIMPYGGVKDSGIGREGPRYAIEEYTVTRMAMIRPTARR